MSHNESTKTTKARREEMLVKFLEAIKADGTWRNWLNKSNELHISGVCKYLGEKECHKAWDTSFFRGAGWGVPHKDALNKWVHAELSKQADKDLFGNVTAKDFLPSWLNVDGLPDDVKKFLLDQVRESKRLREKTIALESQLNSRERRVLELQTELDAIRNAQHAQDEHYMFSIRTLTYD